MSIHERESQLHDLLEGSMSVAERRELESHLEVCPECRRALVQARHGEDFLKKVSIKPTPDLVDRIMEGIRHAPPLKHANQPKMSIFDRLIHFFFPSWSTGWAFGLGILLAVAVGFLILNSSSRPPSSVRYELPSQTSSTQEKQTIIGILCRAEGAWSSPTLSRTGSFTSDTTFKTGSDGKLEFFLNGGGGHVIAGPDTMITLRSDQVSFEHGIIWCEIEKRNRMSPLIVSAEGNRIEVVGTRFGVRKSQKGIETLLVEGSLRLSTSTGESRPLRAGELALFCNSRIGIHSFTDEERAFWARFFGNRYSDTRLESTLVRSSPATASSCPSITPSTKIASSPVASFISSVNNPTPDEVSSVSHSESPDLMQMLNDHQPASTP